MSTDQGRTWFVAPDGSDDHPGTKAQPFATLERARDAVRAAGKDASATVYLRGGTYRLTETLVLGLEDGGTEGKPVTYAAYPGEEPILTSGVTIGGWRKLEDPPPELPEAARGQVWVADVPEARGGNWRFRTLFDGETLLPRARSDGFLPGTVTEGMYNRWKQLTRLEFPKGALKNWDNLEDVEVLIRPTAVWIVNYLGLKSVDEAEGVAFTTVPGTYTLNGLPPKHADISAWVENVLEALTEPGEWVLDTREGRLYLWPRDGEPGEAITAPTLHELVRVEGKNVEELEGDEPVRNLVFKGLTFTGGERDILGPEDKGIQHDWDMYDKPNALLRFRGAEDCTVDGCTFRNSGGSALRVDLYGQHLKITNNHIHHVGGTCILLCGYGPGLKDVNKGHLVSGNHLHHGGQLLKHSMGIFVWQSGENRILNNRLHDLPYDAIVLSGVRPRFFGISDPVKWTATEKVIPDDLRENMRVIRREETGQPATARDCLRFAHARNNLVQDNELHHVMEELGDGNAIYFSCAGVGNVVHRNLIYDSRRAVNEIRFDDDQQESSVAENIIIGNGIKLKHANYLENNIVIGGALHIRKETEPGARLERNIVYKIGPFETLHDGGDKALGLVHPDRNLFWSDEDPKTCRALLDHVQALGFEPNSIVADPQFVDLDGGDFRLKPTSPAHALGIQSIDAGQVGLPGDPALPRLRREGYAFRERPAVQAEVYE